MKKSLIIFVIIYMAVFSLQGSDPWIPTDIRIDTGDTAGANSSLGPQIACSGSHVYVVWRDDRNSSHYKADIYFNASTDNGATWQASDIRLNTRDTGDTYTCIRSQIACSGSNVYVVWQDARNGSYDIYLNASTDNGATWQTSDIRLDTGDTAGANSSWYPRIACSGSNVYVVWQDERNGNYDIYLNASTDNGATWQASDIRLDTGDTAGANGSGMPQIACSGNNVYVAWEDDRNGAHDVYFNYSSDSGATWQVSDTRLDTGDIAGADYSMALQIACSGDNVYAVWRDSRTGAGSIYFNYSTNAGADWQAADIRLDHEDSPPGAPAERASDYPRISCSDNNVYVIWQDGRNGSGCNGDIYFNHSTDNGATWQESDIKIADEDCIGLWDEPSHQISCSDEKIYVVWHSAVNGCFDVFFNHSTDGGATWQESPIRLDTGDAAGTHNSQRPQIVCSGSNVNFVWEDQRNGSSDIYFNRVIPGPGITANGSEGKIIISDTDPLKIKISLDPAGLTDNADWWVMYNSPDGWFHYHWPTRSWEPGRHVSRQRPLKFIESRKVFKSPAMPSGRYRFLFGVDLDMDGIYTKSSIHLDDVIVKVKSN